MKRHLIKITLWSILCIGAPATTLLAEVPSVMNFQAILLDDQGQIVTDSTYEIEFSLYRDSANLLPPFQPLWVETQKVETEGGLFNALLGRVNPLTPQLFGDECWLEMRLTASLQPFSPRTRLGATPYTYRVASLDKSTGGEVTGSLNPDTLQVGRTGMPGRLSVIQDNGLDAVKAARYNSEGYSFDVSDEAGNYHTRVLPDLDGVGGYFSIRRNTANVAFSVDGNYDGTQEPLVSIIGSARVAEFDMSQAGSGAVQFPSDAIQASEVLDEPGVASRISTSTVTIGDSRTNLLTRTITVPADGFVVATGTFQLYSGLNAGDSVMVYYGLTDNGTTWPSSMSLEVKEYNDAIIKPLSITGIFPVPAGATTFYLVASKYPTTSPASSWKQSLSLLYFPTSYGTVTVPTALSGSDQSRTESEDDERQASARINADRIKRELAAMQARLLELEQTMQDQPAATDAPRQ